MKKIPAILTSIILSISISANSSAYAALADSNNVDEQVFELSRQIYQAEQAMALQDDALEACTFFDNSLPVDNNGEIIYTDSYAGRFIDSNNHLIIQVASSDFSPYNFLCDKYPIVEFNQVQYSKNYLENLLDDYLNTYSDNESVYSAYVDIKSNRAVVEIDDRSISLLSENTDNLPIIFKAGSPLIATAKTIHCGDELRNHKTGTFVSKYSTYSAGIGGRYNGKKAIISAGHGMEVGDKIYSGWTHIGTVAYVQCEEGKPGDFSIITMEGNHTSDAQSKDGTVSFVSHGVFNTPEIGA